MNHKKCRFCGAGLKHSFADLGMSPLANSNIETDRLNQMEPFYPLHAFVCEQCFLVQLEEFEAPKAYFQRLCLFLFFLRFLGTACEELRGNDRGTPELESAQPGGRDCKQ